MVNNLRQLRERHCMSIIQLIKQNTFKKTFCLYIIKNKVYFKYQIENEIGIGIKIF